MLCAFLVFTYVHKCMRYIVKLFRGKYVVVYIMLFANLERKMLLEIMNKNVLQLRSSAT